MAWITILSEIREHKITGEWCLCFQKCVYNYSPNNSEPGYRFIWRRPDDSLQPARGQARIPSIADIIKLIRMAVEDGWLSKKDLQDIKQDIVILQSKCG